ncbi:hypothetical protein KIW84_064383 [Lathyrus oleraceus]|uniref:Uncharacterized protein n=1 Tax=Pisum sativum TaxID=3888 RepID=A0A9D5A908_PEA|nr:hypothetical protein KIW84_064383 [Pisum sativum]
MKSRITPLQDKSEDGGSYKVFDELSSNRDSSFAGNSSPHPRGCLGDVMPHLRAKAQPPPGFCAPQRNVLPDMISHQNPTTFRNTLTGLSEVKMLKK